VTLDTRSYRVNSAESVEVSRPVVEASADGARRLAAVYWSEVQAATAGLIRVRGRRSGVELRVLGRGPALIRLGRGSFTVADGSVTCTYPIAGGLLVRRAGGSLSFEQLGAGPVTLRSTLEEYVPRLRAAGVLYARTQARLHARVSRRYFARLRREVAG
jgi:hypothetical protein